MSTKDDINWKRHKKKVPVICKIWEMIWFRWWYNELAKICWKEKSLENDCRRICSVVDQHVLAMTLMKKCISKFHYDQLFIMVEYLLGKIISNLKKKRSSNSSAHEITACLVTRKLILIWQRNSKPHSTHDITNGHCE